MTILKKVLPVGALVLMSGPVQAQDETQAPFTANIGFLSNYIFRGVEQNTSTANGGLDYETGGFYIGTWAADVGMGLEVDLYGGYGGEIGEFTYSIGATGYYYTDDFDDTYQEINLGGGYGSFSLQANFGEYENFDGPTLDYTFYALTAEGNGFYGTIGSFGDDFDGEYYEVGYGTEVIGLDVGISAIYSDEMLAGGTSGETNLVFSIGKTFGIR